MSKGGETPPLPCSCCLARKPSIWLSEVPFKAEMEVFDVSWASQQTAFVIVDYLLLTCCFW